MLGSCPLCDRHRTILALAIRQADPERAALVRRGLDTDLTAVRFDERARDEEAQSQALNAGPGAVHPVEALEKARLRVGGDADALVSDGDTRAGALVLDAHQHRAAVR